MFSSAAAEYLASIADWKSSDKCEYKQYYVSVPVSSPSTPELKTVSIACKQYKQQAKAPLGLVILFHGIGACASLQASVANVFSACGLDVVAFDQIGHGRSQGILANKSVSLETKQFEAPDCYIPEYQLLIQIGWSVVEKVYKADANRYQNIPVFLFGKSMGGGTIVHMLLHAQASSFPVPIKGVVLEAPFVTLTNAPASILQWGLKGISWIAPKVILTKSDFESFSRIPEQKQSRSVHPECNLAGLTAATSESMIQFSNDAIQKLSSSAKFNGCSVFIAHGTADRVTSHEGSQLVINWCGAVKKELKLIPAGLHGLSSDLCAKEVLEDYCEFVKNQI